jgi:peroxiredoxin
MKNKKLFVLILLLVVAAVVMGLLLKKGGGKKTEIAENAPSSSAAVAPAFELKDLSGKVWRLADLKGKLVLVTFWATWCPSCKEENPSIQKFLEAQKENKDIVYLSVLVQDKPEVAVEYMKANGFTFPVLIDDGNASMQYGITGVPETFIIDRKGNLKDRVIGPLQWDSQQVKTYIARLVSEGA